MDHSNNRSTAAVKRKKTRIVFFCFCFCFSAFCFNIISKKSHAHSHSVLYIVHAALFRKTRFFFFFGNFVHSSFNRNWQIHSARERDREKKKGNKPRSHTHTLEHSANAAAHRNWTLFHHYPKENEEDAMKEIERYNYNEAIDLTKKWWCFTISLLNFVLNAKRKRMKTRTHSADGGECVAAAAFRMYERDISERSSWLTRGLMNTHALIPDFDNEPKTTTTTEKKPATKKKLGRAHSLRCWWWRRR